MDRWWTPPPAAAGVEESVVDRQRRLALPVARGVVRPTTKKVVGHAQLGAGEVQQPRGRGRAGTRGPRHDQSWHLVPCLLKPCSAAFERRCRATRTRRPTRSV